MKGLYKMNEKENINIKTLYQHNGIELLETRKSWTYYDDKGWFINRTSVKYYSVKSGNDVSKNYSRIGDAFNLFWKLENNAFQKTYKLEKNLK